MSSPSASGPGASSGPGANAHPEPPLAGGRLRLDEPAPGVVRLTIDNPAKRNALDHSLLDGLAALVSRLEARCLVLTGSGGMFSAGYDIGDIPDEVFPQEAEKLVAHPFTAAIKALEAFAYPTIAALNGHAIGGGLELAVSCDLRVAAAGIRLGMPPAKLGLIYSHTGIAKFIETVGAPRTRELFYVGRNLTAEKALSWGLVNEVVDADQLESRALELASEIAANAPLSLAGNKRVVSELVRSGGRLAPETEADLVALRQSCFTSEDFREGVRAFAEKRAPRWRGR